MKKDYWRLNLKIAVKGWLLDRLQDATARGAHNNISDPLNAENIGYHRRAVQYAGNHRKEGKKNNLEEIIDI